MKSNNFEKLKKYLHSSENTKNTRKPDKILPVMTQIRTACEKLPLEEKLFCDKQIVSFGRTSIKTYNPKKPHK